jgi:hypothetical protein
MAWRYYRDPRILRVSGEAELLWTHSLALSSEHEADGNVQREALRALCTKGRRTPSKLAAELVDAGLWVETSEGFAVPFETWSRWQETAEQRVAARKKEAAKKAQQRSRPWGTDEGTPRGSPSASGAGAGAGAGHSPTSPAPRRQASPGVGQSPEWEELMDDDGNFAVRLKDAGDL